MLLNIGGSNRRAPAAACSMMPTMKLRHEITYDAPLADVYAMLADPAFRQALRRRRWG